MTSKKTILLKQPSIGYPFHASPRGAARLASEENFSLILSIIDLYPDIRGEYEVVYATDSAVKTFPLGNLSGGTFLIEDDLGKDGAAAVIRSEGGEKTIVLYGAFSPRAPTAEDITARLNATAEYDDEAVAEENYYAFGGRKEQGEQSEETCYDDDIQNNNAIETQSGNNPKEVEEEKRDKTFGAQNGNNDGGSEKRDDAIGRLEKVFAENPAEENLCAMVYNSRWAKISCGERRHYALGVIYEKERPRWICYGLPGKYGEKPTEIKNSAYFVPLSPFALKGNGYWVMYQDAEKGAAT